MKATAQMGGLDRLIMDNLLDQIIAALRREPATQALWCEAIVATQDGTSGRMVCDVENLLHYVNSRKGTPAEPATEGLRKTPRVDELMDSTSPIGFKGPEMVNLARDLEIELKIQRELTAGAQARYAKALERGPATEAVRDQVLEEAASLAYNYAVSGSEGFTARKIAQAIRALKGKGASQGDGLAKLAALPSEMQTLAESLAPEPSGEFVRVPREPTGEMVIAAIREHHRQLSEWEKTRRGNESFKLAPSFIYSAMLAASPDEQKG